MNDTGIDWTDQTWNPVTGCEKVSEGCRNCYFETLTKTPKFRRGFPRGFGRLHYRPHKLREPFGLKLKRLALELGRAVRIFVNSDSDFFWEQIHDAYRDRIVDIMEATPQHHYQILTHRPEEMLRYTRRRPLPPHCWVGVTIESNRLVSRATLLRQVDVPIRFISAEPLLSPLTDLDLSGIAWLIAGGESGPMSHGLDEWLKRTLVYYHRSKCLPRPDRIDWIRELRDKVHNADIPFFFKQWGGLTAKSGGCMLDGRTWKEFPDTARTAGAGVRLTCRITPIQ